MNAIQLMWINTGIFVSITILVLNIITRGFLLTILKAKMSRGKLKLVKVYSKVDIYYRVGKVIEEQLKYTDRNKLKKSIKIEHNNGFDFVGLKMFEVDEAKNCIRKNDHEFITGFDATVEDILVERALNQPNSDFEEKMIMMLKICLFAIAILVMGFLVIGYHVFTIKDMVFALGQVKGVI